MSDKMKNYMLRSAVMAAALTASLAFAHEPIFGLGPGTIYKGGIGLEFEWEGERITNAGKKDSEQELHQEIIYGITPDFAVTLSTPYPLSPTSGLGDIALRAKHRFWRKDGLGYQDSAAYILGVKFPSGSLGKGTGTGSTDLLFGITAGHEGRKWYSFGDMHYLLRTEGGGDTVFANAAVGIRPWDTGYLSSDWVFYLELNFESAGIGSLRSRKTLFLAPSAFITYRNWAFRGGWQFPISQTVNGNAQKIDSRSAFSIEVHY